MAHNLAPTIASIPSTIPTSTPKATSSPSLIPYNGSSRRALIFGLAGTGVIAQLFCENANAAARRPPPPPPTEKKDPNISGVQAKVLASKKRKEAMKEEIAKLREKGKPVKGEAQAQAQAQAQEQN